MSNRIFQGLVHQMRDAVGRTLGVIDETGTIIRRSTDGAAAAVSPNTRGAARAARASSSRPTATS